MRTIRVILIAIISSFSNNIAYSETRIDAVPLAVETYDSNNKLVCSYSDKLLRVKVLGRIEGTPPRIQFQIMNKVDQYARSYSGLDIAWFPNTNSKYHFTYEVDQDNKIMCVVWFYSNDFDSTEICLTVPSKYDDNGYVIFNYFDSNGNRTRYNLVEIAPEDAKKILFSVSKGIIDYHYPKMYNNTLYPDVFF